MSKETEDLIEIAKAAQEVSKTTRATLKTVDKMGGFISRFISGPLEQGVGIWEDKLKYARWENQVRLMERTNKLMEEMALKEPIRPIPLKLAVPFFQAASLEDDESIQDKWAKLLVNSSAAESGVDLERVYIDILERLSPISSRILDEIYKLPYQEMMTKGVITAKLPASAKIAEEAKLGNPEQPTEEVKLVISNLERLGCLSYPSAWDGGQIFTSVYPTVLGKAFVDACTLNPNV